MVSLDRVARLVYAAAASPRATHPGQLPVIDVRPSFDDPILDLLPLDVPDSYLTLPPDEQAWRGRFFLLLWSAGYDDWLAWIQAISNDPAVRAIYDEAVANLASRGLTIDEEIPKMLAGRRAFEAVEATATA